MKMRIAAWAAFIALTFAGVVSAQAPPETDPAPLTVSGTVISKRSDSLVIRTDDGSTRTYVIEASSTLPTTPLNPGTHVTVLYRNLDAARVSAVSVVPTTPTDPPSAAQSSEMPATAGFLPLAGLLGLGMLAGGIAVRALQGRA